MIIRFLSALCAVAAFGATFDGRQPQLASRGDIVAMTFASGQTIWTALSRDGGHSWSEPVRVAEAPVLSLGNHRGPRIAIADGVMIVSAIAGAQGMGKDGDIGTWRSIDDGRTWTPGPRVNDRESSAREGLHAMAAGPKGSFYAVWLDDRNGKKAVYGALSTDGGLSWTSAKIYQPDGGSVCECCHPSVAFAPDGTIYVMFRNALDGSRDMYLATSRDGGRKFTTAKLGDRTWKLEACPMDGGGISVGNTRVDTVWRRGSAIFESRPGNPEREIGGGKNPAISSDWIVWTAPDGLYGRRRNADPKRLDEKGGFPALATTARGSVVAYEKDAKIATAVLE